MKRLALLLTVLLLLLPTGCTQAAAETSGKLQIVATAFPQYDMAKQIAGDQADVSLLLSAGQEIHSFEPTPMDVAEISRCDLFLRIGGESEVWTDTLLAAVDTTHIGVVTLMNCIAEPLAEEEHHHAHEHEHEEQGEWDEHIWNSPVNAIAMAEAVRDALCAADTAHAEAFRERADAYIAQLSDLDEQFRALADACPDAVLIVADRFPFRYLAAAYGFHFAAAFSGCSSETEPTIGSLYRLLEEYEEHDCSAVLYLDFSSDKIADRIREMTGARVLKLYPCHTVSAEQLADGVTLPELMEQNYLTIKEALQ